VGWPRCLGSQMVVGFDSRSDATEAGAANTRPQRRLNSKQTGAESGMEVGTVSTNEVTGERV
jgi:hypothetical protein